MLHSDNDVTRVDGGEEDPARCDGKEADKQRAEGPRQEGREKLQPLP